MKTPKEYVKYLTQGICNEQMLADVIYSYNKRAKNYRDKKRDYRNYYKTNHTYDKYDNEWRAQMMMDKYYAKKEDLLMKLCIDKVTCIHKHKIKERRRVYDYEKEYETVTDYCYANRYFDEERDDYVYFIDFYEDSFRYYLFFNIGDKSFHSQIKIDLEKFLDKEQFKNTEIVELSDDFYTHGEETSPLLSVQFCDKVYEKFILETTQNRV